MTHKEKSPPHTSAHELTTRKLAPANRLGEVVRNALGAYLKRKIDFSVTGQEHLEKLKSGAIVVVAPHNGHIDAPLVRLAFEKEYRKLLFYLVAADYWDKPIHSEDDTFLVQFKNNLSTHLRKILLPAVARSFPVDRFDSEQAISDLAQAAQKVLTGEFVVLYPEGTRSRDGSKPMSERNFKSGLGMLVLMTDGKVPIIPVYIEGNEHLMPAGSNHIEFQKDGAPHQVTVHIGAPIDLQSLVTQPLNEMDDTQVHTFRRMTTNLVHGHFVGKYERLQKSEKKVEPY